jgi:hypothetical protein
MRSQSVWSQNVTDLVYVARHLAMTLCTFLGVLIIVSAGICLMCILAVAYAIIFLIHTLTQNAHFLLSTWARRITDYYHGRDIGMS